jgi:hypothetical protein
MVTNAPDQAPALYRDDETPAQRRARHLRNLEALAELGLAAARDLGAQLKAQTEAVAAGQAPADPAAADKLALGLSRAARSVRLTYAMIERWDRGDARPAARAVDRRTAEGDAGADGEPAKPQRMIWMGDRLVPLPPVSAYTPEQQANATVEKTVETHLAYEGRRALARKRIIEDTVEASINAEAKETGREREVQDRCAALYARIDELWEGANVRDFLDRPIIEMARRVCADLKVRFEPERWKQADWAMDDAKEPYEIAGFIAAADPRRLSIRCSNGRDFLRGQSPPKGMVLPTVDPPPVPSG